MIKLVTFPDTFPDSGKYAGALITGNDIMNDLEDKNGFPQTGAAKNPGFGTLGQRSKQVNNLDPGFEKIHLVGDFMFVKRRRTRCGLSNRQIGIGNQIPFKVNRLAEHIKHPAVDSVSSRKSQGLTGRPAGRTPPHAVCRIHGNTAADIRIPMLDNFQNNLAVIRGLDQNNLIKHGQIALFKTGVHN